MSQNIIPAIVDEIKFYALATIVSFGLHLPILLFPLTNESTKNFFFLQAILFFMGSVVREVYAHFEMSHQTVYCQLARAAVNYLLLMVSSILVHNIFSDVRSSPYFYGGLFKTAHDLALTRYFCSFYHCVLYADQVFH